MALKNKEAPAMAQVKTLGSGEEVKKGPLEPGASPPRWQLRGSSTSFDSLESLQV